MTLENIRDLMYVLFAMVQLWSFTRIEKINIRLMADNWGKTHYIQYLRDKLKDECDILSEHDFAIKEFGGEK